MINSHGHNVNAVKGFFYKMQNLRNMFDPDYIVFGSDLSREKTFRRKMFKDYKAQRKPKDEDIIRQLKWINQLTALMGFPIINNETYEADDVLGMISRLGEANGDTVIIVTSDRDLYQLVTDKVNILNPRTGDLIDRDYIYDKYHLTPEQWIDLKILQGDRSDNIPGVAGIGEVTALSLMQTYGSIDEIYKNINYLKPRIKDALILGRNVIPLTRDLVTIVTDYTKIDLTYDMISRQRKYPNEVFGMIMELEIPSLVNVIRYSLLPEKEERL
jgi:DNA polymerase-1